MDLWQYVKDLFKAEQESSSLKPFIQEPLERLQDETESYEIWKRTLAKQRLLDWLNIQYATFTISGESEIDKTIDFLNTPTSKGFVIHFNDKFHNRKDIINLFDYLKERVLEMDYKIYMSDTRTYNQTRNDKNWVETIERHYLKPRFKVLEDNTFDQRFGNIKVELLFRNDVIRNLQFSATRYHDRNYKEANSFNDLMRELLRNS
jgi:hypothetical protein